MAEVSACPDRDTLAQLLDGRTNDEGASQVEKHLLTCQSCCQALEDMGVGDTLIESIRGATGLRLPLDADVQGLMARLKTVSLPSSAHLETLASQSLATDDAWGLEQILDPPQAAGELGRVAGYRVLRVLGAGGMGIVFDAEDPHLQRHVALKVMKPRLARNDEQHKRFLREARAAAAIEHAHIVPVYQVGEHRGLPYLVMQLLKGESLDDRLRRGKEDGPPGPSSMEGDGLGRPSSANGPLPLDDALRIGRETAEALAVAHERKLIHRDIKPANIWLESPQGWVKLLDFGLAHAVEEEVHLTQTGTILGTPAYMAPEQARGDRVGPSADLFSLGAVLYRLTTGQPPFQGPSTLAVLTALAVERPKPPRELNPEIPIALAELIERLLAKNPAERFDSAEAVAEAIRAIEQQHLVAGAERSDAPVRRRPRWPRLAAAAAAFCILAAIVIIVRDKQGREVARFNAPQGGSVTIIEGDGTGNDAKPVAAQRDNALAGAPQPAETEAILAEPPSLEDWLKGREIITVAQNGTAGFKTIQEALAALKPGQAVEILDRGPYRETLGVVLPPNTGLVSRRGTVVEWNGNRKSINLQETGRGHFFNDANDFRLSGLAFVGYNLDEFNNWEPAVMIGLGAGAVIENCWFQGALADRQIFALHISSTIARKHAPCVVRDCIFEGQLNANGGPNLQEPRILVERNWFRDMPRTCPLEIFGSWASAEIRQNVMGLTHGFTVNFMQNGGGGDLVFSHNTLPQGAPGFFQASTGPRVRIDHNILANGVRLNPDDSSQRSDLIKSWHVGHNHYLNMGEDDAIYPKTESDRVGGLDFLSFEADEPDYLRIKGRNSRAPAGLDSERDYVGAFPAGPAPKEGDWFTRLQERSAAGGWALPTTESKVGDAHPTIPEPPPLEEWLRGRDVLTVAQDGSGQFKTIQEALSALKPRQAVEVLDAGPYRETLRLERVPKDVGLISRCRTTIELSEWRRDPRGGPERFLHGHVFYGPQGFRLSGFRFVYKQNVTHLGATFWDQPFGLVIDDCAFFPAPGSEPNINTVAVHVAWTEKGAGEPVLVRECMFAAGGVQIVGMEPGSAYLSRNYFAEGGIHTVSDVRRLVIRDNVFADRRPLFVNTMIKTPETFEISNNTFFGSGAITFWQQVPARGVVLRNNLLRAGVEFKSNVPPEERARAQKHWTYDHNALTSRDEVFASASDVVGEPGVLSADPAQRDYLRIARDGPLATGGAGGEWPSYIGALPPGPAPDEGDWFTRLEER